MGIGHKGMLFAAKVMALAGLEFMTNPGKLDQAKEEFREKKKKTPYTSPLRDGLKPF